eukprot:scaffold26501_cov116-Cyclotella_meneghiniana.AAC.1
MKTITAPSPPNAPTPNESGDILPIVTIRNVRTATHPDMSSLTFENARIIHRVSFVCLSERKWHVGGCKFSRGLLR